MARSRPMLAAGFMVCALALAGIPPTSGFVGKYLLVLAAFEAGALLAGGVAVVVSLFTLLSMIKIWNGAFWGDPTPATLHERILLDDGHILPAGASVDHPAEKPVTSRWRVASLVAPCVAIGAATLALGLGANGLLELIIPAADALIDPSGYLQAVRGS